MLTQQEKQKIIEEFKKKENDTGSVEIQIGLLTKKIEKLSEHLKIHKKDKSSKRGLLRMIGRRRKLLNYLKKTDKESYEKILKPLSSYSKF
jgi:small subunit ribosomal protein S15